MSDAWLARLDGWEWVPGNDAGSHAGAVDTIVLHSTESGTIEGAVNAYRGGNSWPHATVDPVKRRRVQHVPLDRAARALRNENAGVETNRAGVLQVEVVGFAGSTIPAMTNADADWLATEVIRPLINAQPGVPVHFYEGPWVGGEGYGVNARQRMSFDQWRHFAGICAHQHVPENSHWDAPFRIDRLAAALGAAPTPPEDDMTPEQAQMLAEVHQATRTDWGVSLSWPQWARMEATIAAAVSGQQAPPAEVDVAALAAQLREGLGDELAKALGERLTG